jgi:hypothetical protein
VKFPPVTLSIVTENTDLPKLVGFVERSIDVQSIGRQLIRVQFLLELAGNMERLLSRIKKNNNTAVGGLL